MKRSVSPNGGLCWKGSECSANQEHAEIRGSPFTFPESFRVRTKIDFNPCLWFQSQCSFNFSRSLFSVDFYHWKKFLMLKDVLLILDLNVS